MSNRPVLLTPEQTWLDQAYAAQEKSLAVSFAEQLAEGPVFRTNAEGLFDLYLAALPEQHRKHYTCSACRNFIDTYCSLVTIGPDGTVTSLIGQVPCPVGPFLDAFADISRAVHKADITGPFFDKETVLGKPVTGEWTHFHSTNPKPFSSRVLTASQAEAEKKQDFEMLSRAMGELSEEVLAQAVRVLEADAMDRSVKTHGIAVWALDLKRRLDETSRSRRTSLLWRAVMTAPPGFCHLRSSMIGTLLEDIANGLDFETISKRWSDKMHPLKYQRPQVLKQGQIDAAEKLVDQLGVRPSLDRRFARLEDVLSWVWRPHTESPSSTGSSSDGGKLFSHLKPTAGKVQAPAPNVKLPAQTMRWTKFVEEVLPQTTRLLFSVPRASSDFTALVTAVHPDAPPIIQWDGLEGHPRNPTTWYVYTGGSHATRWNLTPGEWVEVEGVCVNPAHWQDPDKFKHHSVNAMLVLKGCRDSYMENAGGGLFPEVLRSDMHSIRSVIEAHSNSQPIQGKDEASACGLTFGPKMSSVVSLKATLLGGVENEYKIDRWD